MTFWESMALTIILILTVLNYYNIQDVRSNQDRHLSLFRLFEKRIERVEKQCRDVDKFINRNEEDESCQQY